MWIPQMDWTLALYSKLGPAATPLYLLPGRQCIILPAVDGIKLEGTVLHQFCIQPAVSRMVQILKENTEQIAQRGSPLLRKNR